MTESEKFRTERLVARPWQLEDLPLAMELWGDPAVTALIHSRGKLTNAQVACEHGPEGTAEEAMAVHAALTTLPPEVSP